jgi:hypothetical protein
LYVSLLTFTLHVHPERLDYVDQVLVCFLLINVINTLIWAHKKFPVLHVFLT